MPLGLIRVDPADFPEQEMPCLRCGASARLRFAGPCPECVETLRATVRGEAHTVDAEYVPKMNVTPNAVALNGD
jgi:hypothetical protein